MEPHRSDSSGYSRRDHLSSSSFEPASPHNTETYVEGSPQNHPHGSSHDSITHLTQAAMSARYPESAQRTVTHDYPHLLQGHTYTGDPEARRTPDSESRPSDYIPSIRSHIPYSPNPDSAHEHRGPDVEDTHFHHRPFQPVPLSDVRYHHTNLQEGSEFYTQSGFQHTASHSAHSLQSSSKIHPPPPPPPDLYKSHHHRVPSNLNDPHNNQTRTMLPTSSILMSIPPQQNSAVVNEVNYGRELEYESYRTADYRSIPSAMAQHDINTSSESPTTDRPRGYRRQSPSRTYMYAHHPPLLSSQMSTSNIGDSSDFSEDRARRSVSTDTHTTYQKRTEPSGSGSEPQASRDGPAKKKKTSKMHECEICGKMFPRPSGLNTHMNTHTDQKPFPCEYPGCTRVFSVRSNAKRHMRTHGIIPTSRNDPPAYVVGFQPVITPSTSAQADDEGESSSTQFHGTSPEQEDAEGAEPRQGPAPGRPYRVRWMPLAFIDADPSASSTHPGEGVEGEEDMARQRDSDEHIYGFEDQRRGDMAGPETSARRDGGYSFYSTASASRSDFDSGSSTSQGWDRGSSQR